MLRSLYAGISGMKVNQTKLDVIANNIANVGTTAFKSSRIRFQDMISQSMSDASSPSTNTGGINPKQVGLGVQVAGIDTMVGQGMMQPTSRNLDVAMDGEGYLIVASGPINGKIPVDSDKHTMGSGTLNTSYTRDGALTLDYEGNLLTSDGFRVMGYSVGSGAGSDLSLEYNGDKLTASFVDGNGKGAIEADTNLMPLSIPNEITIPSAAEAAGNAAGIKAAALTGATAVSIAAAITAAKTTAVTDAGVDAKAVADTAAATAKAAQGITAAALVAAQAADTAGTTPTTVATLASAQADDTAAQAADTAATAAAATATVDGEAAAQVSTTAKVTTFAIEKDGTIKATLDDNTVTVIGQIAMASFNNPAGLSKTGKNSYVSTSNSGEPVVRSGIGADSTADNSGSYADMLSGMLEMSNVDLAEQFTDMIVASRAFQANGKAITTGDEILQDIIGLKR
ncbi:flagellar hook-basal body complex protein [Clostridium sp.]|uniref:flagellar hook-basal body complex protein n=1 Tax=Clostridium sp. TaxID=1506 RepID=UPI001A54257F|nr:flagellar hook-basal body complex protein [Clostridium sp.]MBK5240409.1 flagellar hook-basal body complex protein [Clostridium sp.]